MKSKFEIKKLMVALCIMISIAGCSYDFHYDQLIEINHYSENEKNAKLAEDLMYYDPRYIAYKMPVYNEQTSRGIRLGYFIRASDKKANYKISYSLTNPNVVIKFLELKDEFNKFIPELVAFHVSKESIFKSLEPYGRMWAESLCAGKASGLLKESSTLLKGAISAEEFPEIVAKISSAYGPPEEVAFVRAQYYEEFEGIPESVSLFYVVKNSNQKKAMVRISMHQQNEKWLVMGFRVES